MNIHLPRTPKGTGGTGTVLLTLALGTGVICAGVPASARQNPALGPSAPAVIAAVRRLEPDAVLLGVGDPGPALSRARNSQRARRAARRQPRFYDPIDVVVNNDRVVFPDQGPRVYANRAYVPLRGVLEKMGARVFWDEPTRTMIAQRRRTEIRFPANGYATINGDRVLLDTPAFLVDGRVMVPLRFLAENLGARVAWDRREREVTIVSGGQMSSAR